MVASVEVVVITIITAPAEKEPVIAAEAAPISFTPENDKKVIMDRVAAVVVDTTATAADIAAIAIIMIAETMAVTMVILTIDTAVTITTMIVVVDIVGGENSERTSLTKIYCLISTY